MLIIFDLDDTLIDTSGSVTPFKLKACVKKLDELGFPAAHKERELFRLDSESARSKDAVLQFAAQFSLDPQIGSLLLRELTSPLPKNFTIPLMPNAKEILDFFRSCHHLALVTGGHPPFQREKMEKAGIEPAIFSKIEIPEDSNKKPIYQALLREFSISPQDAWVCGDRISMDLLPAQELGMNAVRMRWGRGGREAHRWLGPTICDLRELKEIIR